MVLNSLSFCLSVKLLNSSSYLSEILAGYSNLSVGYSTEAQTLRFVPSHVRAAQGTRSLTSALSSGAVRLLPSLSQPQFPRVPVRSTLCLFWRADHWLRPSRRMSTIQNLRKSLVRNWKPVCSLVGDALSGAEFAPFRPGAHLPPSSCPGGGWAGPQPASSSLSFVLLTGWLCLRLGLSV